MWADSINTARSPLVEISLTTVVVLQPCRASYSWSKQEKTMTGVFGFPQSMTKCLGFDNLEENQQQLVPAILSLTPLPHESRLPETKAGSQLLQSLLKFQKPIKVKLQCFMLTLFISPEWVLISPLPVINDLVYTVIIHLNY